MQFEWDEKKRAINLLEHGLDFAEAVLVFLGQHLVEPTHPGTDGARFRAIGQVGTAYVTVMFTWRGETIRVISFRRARDGERRRYEALHG